MSDTDAESASVAAVSLEKLSSYEAKLGAYYHELLQLKINTKIDYMSGIEPLFNEILLARTYTDRASFLAAETIRIKRAADTLYSRQKRVYQNKFNATLIKTALRYEYWKAQESAAEDAVIAEGWELEDVQNAYATVIALAEAIDVLTKSLFRARNDLQPLVDILRIGEHLKEVTA